MGTSTEPCAVQLIWVQVLPIRDFLAAHDVYKSKPFKQQMSALLDSHSKTNLNDHFVYDMSCNFYFFSLYWVLWAWKIESFEINFYALKSKVYIGCSQGLKKKSYDNLQSNLRLEL